MKSLFSFSSAILALTLFLTNPLSNFWAAPAQKSANLQMRQKVGGTSFFLSRYFRDHFSTKLQRKDDFEILKIEVWVTNATSRTEGVHNVVGLCDLGEPLPINPKFSEHSNNVLPQNNANSLYGQLTSNPNNRILSNIVTCMINPPLALRQEQDFQATYARRMSPGEYDYNPHLGYMTIKTSIRPNDVLGVAFQYKTRGKTYQVGEFSTDAPDEGPGEAPNVLFLKLLRPTRPEDQPEEVNLIFKEK